MKKIYIALLSMICSLSACYNNEGGNDYDTSLDDVEITIPGDAYSAGIGEQIKVTPTIKTSIPENDLEYLWEVNGNIKNNMGRDTFVSLVAKNAQSKELDYTCHLDSSIIALNTSYQCRLHIRQKSTGRDFYSSNLFTITIQGVTGLMVLHGDDSNSDIGVLEAEEFMPSNSSLPDHSKAISALYSNNNGGKKIEGKGKTIVQGIPENARSNFADHYDLVAVTDKSADVMNNTDFSSKGGWMSLFYLKDARQVNANKPKGFFMDHTTFVAFDGDEVYFCEPNNTYPFLFPEFKPTTVCGDGNMMTFQPHLLRIARGGTQVIIYANSVNGESQKGFVGLQQVMQGNTTMYTGLLDTKSDKVVFNPGDMKADLMKMSVDTRGHVMAALKGDNNNPEYPGKYFAVDLAPNIGTSAGKSGNADIPQHIYDLSGEENIGNAFAFDFGSSQNMCYYATPSGVYVYGVDGNTLYKSSKISMKDGSAYNLSGEVTMMMLLNSPNVKTRNTDEILLVATWNGSESTLHALHIEASSGKISTAVKYNKETVEGWNFGKIYDVNIKAQ